MSDGNVVPSTALVYQGTLIADKGEMLSLTDMWKAAGSLENREPFNWSRKEGGAFIDAVALAHNLTENQVMTTRRGKGGATFAHWQIGLAYAKYLSPEFHMWCNQVVRERMEGHAAGTSLTPATLEQIERTFGVIRMVAHKVTEMERALPGIVSNLLEPMVAAKLAEQSFLLRHGRTAKQLWDEQHLPPRLRGATTWLGNRLTEMGCAIENGGKADRGNGTVRLFDPDKSAVCLRNGLLHKARAYAERIGQGKLRLVTGEGV